MKLLRFMKHTESEKTLEARLVDEVKKRNGWALKYTSQFHRGIPDRIVLLPHRTIFFVEMKSTGKSVTTLQDLAMAKLKNLGFKCFVIDSSDKLDDFLSEADKRLARIEARIAAETK